MKMMKQTLFVLFALVLAVPALRAEDEIPSRQWTSEEAWAYLPTYQYGDDWKPLLLIEDEVDAMAAEEGTRAEAAARLAALLNDDSTLAARQFVCMQLRRVAGAEQVPAIAALLDRPDERENARIALEVIHVPEALVPLRAALDTFEGTALVGVINTLTKRQDAESFDKIAALAKSEDKEVAGAAVYALGKFGPKGLEALQALDTPVECPIAAAAMINAANNLAAEGDIDAARAIFEKYAVDAAPRGMHRAALIGLIKTAGEGRDQLIADWFASDDIFKIQMAGDFLGQLSDEQFQALADKQDSLSPAAKVALIDLMADKNGGENSDALIRQLDSPDPQVRAITIRTLGRLNAGDGLLSRFIDLLDDPDEQIAAAANDAIQCYPNDIVLAELKDKLSDGSKTVIDLIAERKCYEAIDPLIELVKTGSGEVRANALAGLSRLADPDEFDLPRLIALIPEGAANGYLTDVERTITIVCDGDEAAGEKVLTAARKVYGTEDLAGLTDVLPLLGRLGGAAVLEQVNAGLRNPDAKVRAAAFKALCAWPDDSVSDMLWSYSGSNNPAVQKQALRAFIRVLTLKSDRDPEKTLSLLKKAFDAARNDEDRNWALTRASEVRILPTVEWLETFLEMPALNQAACASIAKMAHHRDLREPNKEYFVKVLEKVEATATDPDVVEAAKKARMGM